MMRSFLFAAAFLFGQAACNTACDQKTFYDCPADPHESFTAAILLEYKEAFPPEFCKLQDIILDKLVYSYNHLARLHCDVPCFRRAYGAKFVTAACDGSKKPIALGNTPLQDERAVIVELYIDQTGGCTTALDVPSNSQARASAGTFKDVCLQEVDEWEYYDDWFYHYDDDKVQPKHPGKCCCPCDGAQTLAEDDLLFFFREYLNEFDLPPRIASLTELEMVEGCNKYKETYEQAILTEYTGKDPIFDEYHLSYLNDIYQDLYAGISLNECDGLGRQIESGKTREVMVGRDYYNGNRHLFESPAGYANAYPQAKCLTRACTETVANARANCKSIVCPDDDDFALFHETGDLSLTTRRLSDFERMLKKDDYYDYYLPSTVDFVYDHCVCLAHSEGTGELFTVPEFVTQFNAEMIHRREFIVTYEKDYLFYAHLGVVHNLTEYDTSPVAGPPVDYKQDVLAYFEGPVCKVVKTWKDKWGTEYREYGLDIDLVNRMVELVRNSYNDMAIEECDWPLYRQMVEAEFATDFFKGDIDCNQLEFVLDLTLTFRCHGHCDPKDPLFAPYTPHSGYRLRHLAKETDNKVVEAKTESNIKGAMKKEEAAADMLPRDLKKSDDDDDDYYNKGPLLGLCSLDTVKNPSPPSFDGWLARANYFAPPNFGRVDIILEDYDFCRCEYYEEHLYPDGYSGGHYGEYAYINGIYVVPFKHCSGYTGGRERKLQYTADLFYC